ncbi:chondroadherin-like [Pleurodeles waltl]
MSWFWSLLLGLATNSFALLVKGASTCPAMCTCLAPQCHVLCQNASLVSVPSGLPEDTLELHLENNNLTQLEPGAFLGLIQLNALHLSSCGLRHLLPGAFEGLCHLEHLHLEGNQLESLDEGMFGNLSSLLYLHLENNHISCLGQGAFQFMNKLSALYLSHNQLTELSDQSLNGLPQLRWLFLDNNLLFNISTNAFSGLKQLHKLSLEANNLTSVPRTLRQAKSLQFLQLSKNTIRKLNPFGRRLRSLTEIYLDEVGLQEASASFLVGMRRLRILSLKGNRLKSLSLPLIKGQTELRLGGNPFCCDCRLLWLHVYLQVTMAKGGQEEVLCSTPMALSGQHLLSVEVQKLTCPAFGTSVTTATYKSGGPPAVENITNKVTSVLATTVTTLLSPLQHHMPTSNTILERLDPCFADVMHSVEVQPKGEATLAVTWSAPGDHDRFEVRYNSGEAMQVLWVTGDLAEVELHQLQMGRDYKVCVIPLSKDVAKCTAPSPRQCSIGHTMGTSADVQPVHMPPAPSHSALGTGVGVALVVLVLVALGAAGAYKHCSRQAGFQRHFDDDGPGGERYNPDPYKVDGIYDSIEEDRNIYITAASQWVTEVDEKLDYNLATPASILATPRYATL